MKILLVEDDSIVRECVESLVDKSGGALQLLTAQSIEEGSRLASANEDLEVALLGVEREKAEPYKLVRRFHLAHEHVTVVVLAPREEENNVVQALNAGASGYIGKHVSTRTLLRSLRVAMTQGIYVPPSVLSNRGLHDLARGSPQHAAVVRLLTAAPDDRLAMVARMMLRGRSHQAIAQQLQISQASVRAEVSCILKMLSVTNRTEAIFVVAGVLHQSSFAASLLREA